MPGLLGSINVCFQLCVVYNKYSVITPLEHNPTYIKNIIWNNCGFFQCFFSDWVMSGIQIQDPLGKNPLKKKTLGLYPFSDRISGISLNKSVGE